MGGRGCAETLARRAIGPFLLLMLAYAAAPYVVVWHLSNALRQGDAMALRELVDWGAVRTGLKDDITNGLVGMGGGHLEGAGDFLPPFGASFVAGIAGSAVDHDVTPEHLVAMLRQFQPADRVGGPAPPAGVRQAFFETATSFLIEVRCPGQDADDEPLRLRLAISDGAWRVVRAWVPQDLLDQANSRT